jgi:6,7-dimethyl-8-ribityllumazine synthase
VGLLREVPRTLLDATDPDEAGIRGPTVCPADDRPFSSAIDAARMVRLGLVVARYNASVTDPMAKGAQEAAGAAGADIAETVRVPGAYDAPLAADRLARREDVDAVAVVGAIVTGDTDHDRVIGDATARALTRVSLDRDTPVTFGVSGPGMSGAEARERVDKGAEAVNAAIEMVRSLP